MSLLSTLYIHFTWEPEGVTYIPELIMKGATFDMKGNHDFAQL